MAGPASSRLIIANLDAELSWARGRLRSHATLPRDVTTALAATGACMAVYGQPGDRLWLPAEIDPGRLGPLLAGIGIELISGEIPADADQVTSG